MTVVILKEILACLTVPEFSFTQKDPAIKTSSTERESCIYSESEKLSSPTALNSPYVVKHSDPPGPALSLKAPFQFGEKCNKWFVLKV